MTIDRAIEILDPEHREHYASIEPVNEACRMGMEALRKQKPHKLAPTIGVPVCGRCNGIMDLMQGDLNYCPNCGQAIDWTEVEG